ncbi:MAG: flagellar biosynthesis protein FlhA [Nevskiaceae bacterium]|nr:MAG: flagellar biosynthesis protein FlhA [Nevskiaceae bacterium]TBR72185.1 MAG: flagellar biosynthesis protein FlhA [Nevskiaceae bacterium]
MDLKHLQRPDWRAIAKSGLATPVALLLMLGMIVIPLPAVALDVLFTFNIALSIIVVMAVINVLRPLDFSAFPTVLLTATLLRLALNVASTRVVLLHGNEGVGAAGHVIEAFGEFVIGGNYAIGIIVFLILTLINFVVVTKGAGRVSEVTARFTLDAMPGKQMAIDADLNAGLITREEAKQRREEVREEADFYGAMDGASKFVRGDAIAGLLILVVNIVGGLLIGTLSHGMPLDQAASRYTTLTIGDGLVAQIPSLLLSTAVAIIVTRMSRSQAMGSQITGQMLGQPKVLGFTGAVLVILGLIPGMPHFAFLSFGIICLGLAWIMASQRAVAQVIDAEVAEAQPKDENTGLTWDALQPVDAVAVEVGYRLVPLVDRAQGGELMTRIRGVRRKLTQDLGFLIPSVHVRDDLQLSPTHYRVSIHGVEVGSGEVHPDRELALDPSGSAPPVKGISGKDPAFGLPATWIEKAQRTMAQAQGYTVVDPATVIATHLSQLLRGQAQDLLGLDETQHLLDQTARSMPKLVEDLTPKHLPLATLAQVLQGLLAEGISIRNLRTILETLAGLAPRSTDVATLLGGVRVALGRQIVSELQPGDEELPILTLAPAMERVLQDAQQTNALEPGLADRLHKSMSEVAQRQEAVGQPAVLVVAQPLRAQLARFARQAAHGLHVLAFEELPDTARIRIAGNVG